MDQQGSARETGLAERGVIERLEALLAEFSDGVVGMESLRPLTDAELLHSNELHAQLTRLVGSTGAAIAGELAYRSRPELGADSLVRRTGHRTVDNLLKLTTGATKEQVKTVVAAGTLLLETANEGRVDAATGEVFTAVQPWMRAVAVAVAAGSVSTSASQAIAKGLGAPNSAVTALDLEGAVRTLAAAAIAGVDADRLYRDACDLRAELDLAGVALREEEHRQARSFKHFPTAIGGRVIWDLDTESYAIVASAYDRMISPKRGGVRFADPTLADQAQSISDDDRTPAQLAGDGFVHLLMAGADVDGSVLLGTGAPIIRVTVAESALEAGIGLARIDGQPEPVSLDTVKRLLCNGDMIRVSVDSLGIPIETEAEQRLFSKRQREVLAAKFGGCMDPDCDRPASACEAHHIMQWKRDGGKTVLDNGILLCKFHHLKYHNDHYEIVRDADGRYWKVPPTSVDPNQTAIFMPLKSRNLHDLFASTLRAAALAR